MKPAVKSPVESALIALALAGVCLWFLISSANGQDPSAARLTLLGLGLSSALMAHWVFMAVAIRRSGRGVFGWMVAIVLLGPVGTAAIMAVLLSDEKPQQA